MKACVWKLVHENLCMKKTTWTTHADIQHDIHQHIHLSHPLASLNALLNAYENCHSNPLRKDNRSQHAMGGTSMRDREIEIVSGSESESELNWTTDKIE